MATFVLLALALPASAAAAGKPSQRINWAKAAEAPGYEKATAHQPNYADKELWPLSGKEKFVEQKWPAGRQLVWAHPGENGADGDRKVPRQAFDLENWIDAATGKPATELPDETTDILLPASEKAYTVSYRKGGQEHSAFGIRHLTVEAGATFRTSGLGVYGNVWVKRGGLIKNHGPMNFAGDAQTFCRNDNGDPTVPGLTEGSNLTQYVMFNRPGGSCEFLGDFACTDEFRVFDGTFIIGPDSRVRPGRNAVPIIRPQATLALMDGASFGKWCNQIGWVDLRCEGTLQGGMPDRPLTRDAHVGVSYQNTNDTPFELNGRKFWPDDKGLGDRIVPLLFVEGAQIKTYSGELDKACLVIGWVGVEAKDYFSSKQLFRRLEPELQQAFVQQLDGLPKYVTAAFAPQVEVDGLRFERFLKGGILLADPSARESWKNVSYGQNNEAPPDALARKAKVDFKSAKYE